ncbi:MAG: undecaprenyl/decaprenyl-phosphate alpha-N-acetylglucosaminyl 1-phosphate transferase [Elusimicrobia bacterium]|nr:undecaprenyl/decaprenyl-phosphate alpha-N-acetylglucosaminyl 1-phosphate transferase [Elusimicrobiota bacterium]
MGYYIFVFSVSFLLAIMLTPAFGALAKKYNILDVPHTPVKTHRFAIPYLGGVAIFAAFMIALLLLRFMTHFPTGTLHRLRGIFIGTSIIFLLGLADDIYELNYKIKFAVQIVAASVLFRFGIRIEIVEIQAVNYFLTVFWILAVTNGFNIIDVMDGLSSTVIITSALFFFAISAPTEEIYVNFASLAILGGALGFFFYNRPPAKIFMGDAGSLTSGYLMAAVSLGVQYSKNHPVGLFAPVLILAIPLFDMLFVMVHRIKRGLSPFLGSRDHFALRMQNMGFSKKKILSLVFAGNFFLGLCAWAITLVPVGWSILIISLVVTVGFFFANWLSIVEVND